MKTINIFKLVDIVVFYCHANGLKITPLKLQKILYYIQAWHIAKFDKAPLFKELPEAWVNGPVYRSVYGRFKTIFYRDESISTKVKGDYEDILNKEIESSGLSAEQIRLISSVLKFYAPKNEGTLVIKTHADDPWNEAREGVGDFERSTNKITIDSMYNFYNKLLNK